ncbi:chemotaxis protein CheW [Desulfosporosinus sp. FKA]|uniref:chemotaxis protein CheW n=1 Tax=Desulfosporosinus sp. FKA TaxID=1969834 RepID=UPI000B49B777|nr:chemotaxis protein CheW [Desulfosporosinus sp. FKA]
MSSLELVVFTLGEDEYGLEIAYAQEIIRIPERIKRMPDMPPFMEGVIDLRGKVIPILDLKKRFGFMETDRGLDSRLLVLDLEEILVGIIVDDVSEVIKLEEQAVEKLNTQIFTLGSNSVEAIARIDNRIVLILNSNKLKEELLTKWHNEE